MAAMPPMTRLRTVRFGSISSSLPILCALTSASPYMTRALANWVPHSRRFCALAYAVATAVSGPSRCQSGSGDTVLGTGMDSDPLAVLVAFVDGE